MTNELVSQTEQLPTTQLGSDSDFDNAAAGGGYLQYAKMYGKCTAVDRQLIAGGHWGVPKPGNKDNITDLGKAISVLPYARRMKAIDTSDLKSISVSFDASSEEFKRIAQLSEVKDSNCQYGISFLVYENSTGQFLEVFFASKSARMVAKDLYPCLPLTAADIERRKLSNIEPHDSVPTTLGARLAVRPTMSWWVPTVEPCHQPITPPSMDAVTAQITSFLNPKVSEVTKATDNRKARDR